MSCLLRTVMCLPGIKKVNHQDYLLALNQTWEWMSRNLDEFQASTDSLTGALERALRVDMAENARAIASTVRRDGARAAAQRLITMAPLL